MLFMLYDLIILPMQVFSLPSAVVFQVVLWSAVLFWTFDVPLNCVTAAYMNSVLERRISKSAHHYARTWLLFDIMVLIPEYTPLFLDSSSSSSNVKAFKVVRFMRFLKLLRLAKMERFLREALEVINSLYLLICVSITKLMVGLVLFNHVIACIWFWIGESDNQGWVHQMEVEEATILYRYLTSIHWSLTQFQGTSEIVPGTTSERAYAVLFLLCALIILAWFVSILTNNMRQIQDLHAEQTFQQRCVRSYLNENKISSTLSVKVKKYIDFQQRREQHRKHNEEVLLSLPTKLLAELHEEVRSRVLKPHPLFEILSSRALRRICHEAMDEVMCMTGEFVFNEGDECHQMYFIASGYLRYTTRPIMAVGHVMAGHAKTWEEDCFEDMRGARASQMGPSDIEPVRLGIGEWLSEAVLWTEWEHAGDLEGLNESLLLALPWDAFANIAKVFPSARASASCYAKKFVAGLDRFGCTFTDLIDYDTLFCEEEDEWNTVRRGSDSRGLAWSIFNGNFGLSALAHAKSSVGSRIVRFSR